MADNGLIYDYLFDLRPAHWDIVPFPDAVDFQEGPGILARDFRNAGVPLLRLRNITSSTVDLDRCNYLDPAMVDRKWSHFRLTRGDLVLSTSGTLGRVSTVDEVSEGAIPYTGIIRMRPATDRVHAGFIKYFMLSPLFRVQAEAMASGSVLRHYGPSHLRQMTFPVPPLDEQRAIADILSSLDDKIELNRRMNQTLEAMARAIFKSWFIDFDPVRAKVDGNPPPGLDPATAALFPDAFQDSSLGPIPQGWRPGTLGEVADNPRRSIKPEQIDPASAYIALDHMPRRSIALAEWDTAESITSGKYQFNRGDILFGKLRPYFHKVGVAPVDGVCSTDILVVVPKAEDWFGCVLGHISSDEFIRYTDAGSTGTKMPRTNWDYMSRYDVALPDTAVVRAFTEQVGPLIERIHANIRANRLLAALRDALLPKLLSGELRVSEAETFAEELA